MNLKPPILPIIAQTLSLTGLNAILEKKYGGRGVILMMHGFCYDNAKPVNKAGFLTKSYLEQLLIHIKDSALTSLRLSDVPAYLESGAKRRFVVLTCDDGYKNNLDIAAPLFQKYEIPATIFITSGGLNGTLQYEWGGLENYIAEHSSIDIGGYSAKIETLEQKRKAYQYISTMALKDYERWKPLLLDFFEKQKLNMCALVQNSFLNEKELRALASNSMIDIGGHTISHPMLAQCTPEQALCEIKENKEYLQNILQKEICCFAYPYGGPSACEEREYKLAKEAGYKTAVTTRAGAIFNQHQSHLLSLPRFAVNGLYESGAMPDLYFSGSMRALRSRLGSAFSV
jgi:peptidoglycan/xylan/chitin deacetylase (PgdA/CDA1 family)